MRDNSDAQYDHLASASTKRELDLHKRALAGDKKAKAELEAKELRERGVKAVYALEDAAEKGDAQAIAKLKAIADGKAVASAAPAHSAGHSGLSQADVTTAATLATQRERKRVAEVFAAPASKGRERVCATLLASDKAWSASDIIAQLAFLPTDKAAEADVRKKGQAKADAAWDRANAKIGRTAPPKGVAKADPDKGKPVASDPWAKAYASAGRAGGAR